MSKSAVPIPHGFPNPFYERAFSLVQQQQELKSLVKIVKDQSKLPGVDLRSLVENLRGGDFERRLKAIWTEMQTGKTEPELAPPPRPNEIYGRFGKHVSITDICPGNCSKLSLFTGELKISVWDVNPINTTLVVTILSGTIIENLNKAAFITSFMGLVRLEPEVIGKILDQDGLHLVPDYDFLEKEGVAEREEDGRMRVRTAMGTFVDQDIRGPGLSTKTGYRVIAGFTERIINVELAADVSREEGIHIDAAPAGVEDICYDDVTYKYDGTPYELEMNEGNVYFSNRAGELRLGITDFMEHVCVQLEAMSDFYVLIRILEYRGMVPPHSGEVLRHFATRVKIRINGLPVIGPEKWDPRSSPSFPCDGLISRSGERDFYHKGTWTVDLMGNSLARLGVEMQSKGFRLVYDHRPGLWEYELHRDESVVTLMPIRERRDKLKATTFETVFYLLDQRSLSEYEALSGSPWM